MTRKAAADKSPPDFEKSLQELEALVTRLERGDLPLAESLRLFEQGVSLTRSCHSALSEAQQKVEILLREGGVERVRIFDPRSGSTDE